MLPSNEFFKHIFCPYDKAKLCHRPYCHYKHAETGSVENPLAAVEETEYLFDAKPATNAFNPTRSTYTAAAVDNDFDSGYVPSPVVKPVGILKLNSRTNNRNSYSACYTLTDSQNMVIPEYNPTPISWLKELNPSNSTVGISKFDFSNYKLPDSRKKKNTEEYDPTMVKYKCTSKKVMFADEAGIALDDACAPNFSSSEEDVDDLGCAPKFSDDDLDDYSHSKVDRVPKFEAKLPEEEVEEEEILDERSIDEFSLVDKILVSSKKSEKFISNFKKSVLMPEEKKTKSIKDNKKPSKSKKRKTQVEADNVYDCDFAPLKPTHISDFDVVMSMASFDDVKDSEVVDKDKSSKKMSSKNSELSRTKTSSDLATKKDKSEINKPKTSSSDKKPKETSFTSKHLDKSTDSKTKHNKHSGSSDKSKVSKVNSKPDKTEKHKSMTPSSKSEKSSSSNKLSKSEKIKSSTHSSKTDKSNSKISKPDTFLSSNSKSSKDKEDKLQDEKVTSSSIAKKNKYDQSIKHLTKDSHTESSKSSQIKSKGSSNKEDKSNSKVSKRKVDDSDSESFLGKSKVNPKKQRIDMDYDDDDMSSIDGGVDDIIDISSESEDDTEEQCKRIFEETFIANDLPSDKEDSSSAKKPKFVDVTLSQKQRLAHAGATSKKSGPGVQRSHFQPSRHPGQVMLDRFANIRAAQVELNETKDKGPLQNSPSRGKTRISIAPNHSLLAALAEKNRLSQSSNSFSPLPSTVSKTLKVTKRVAHIPDVAVKPRPIIPIDYGSKVPTVVRQKFLNAFIDEYLKLAASEDEAYENALDEEKNAYGRSSSKAIYMNVASNALNRLRHRVAETTDAAAKKSEIVSSTTNSSKKTVSHETLLNGPQAQRTSFSIERKKATPTPDLKGLALYEHLMTYALSEEQLKENGYPFPHPVELGKAVIEGIYANRTQYCNDPFKRTCSRCQKIYYVNVDGDYVRDEECDFHWGRLFKRRIAGALESRYTCCQGDSESDGCCVGTGHVFEGSEAHALKGFVSTLPKSPPPDNYHGIYALDCEMCYTTAGIELTRISVIGPDMKPVYETFVKPQNKVLDFNTRFSGITEENLKNVRTTIRDVQAVLLCMFNTKTILIGHSLESDFKALKLFHKTLVDTSVVFPHKLGLPYKRALRNLSSEKLNKIIQNDVGGHDSAEDAVACMELMIYKIKEDLKGNR